MKKGTFYTYLWLREDGTPFYVGKGTWLAHRFIRQERAFRKGCPPAFRIIIQDHASESDAHFAERFLIAFYGRRDIGTGILRNLTDGGEGLAGTIRTETHKQRISEALKIHRQNNPIKGYDPLAHGLKMRGSGNPMFGKKRTFDSEWCRKLSLGKMGHVHSEETRKKMSESAIKRWKLREAQNA